MLQTMGNKKLGGHCEGLINPAYHSCPKYVNTLPIAATATIPTPDQIHF